MMNDYAVRAVACDGKIRILAAVTTNTVEEARRRHDLSPVASAALGRVLTAGSLLGLTLKGEDLITMRLDGDGPLGRIIADCNANGEVRGYVDNPHVFLPLNDKGKLAVGEAVGHGMLYLTKDLGLKEPYTGSAPLVSGEIGEDLANYFAVSEQLPSAVGLGVLVGPEGILHSGGYMIQLFPDVEEEVTEKLEEVLKKLPAVTDLLQQGFTPEKIIEAIFSGLDVSYLDKQEVKFQCTCGLEKIERVLVALGEKELEDILKEKGQIEVKCHFCQEEYVLSAEEARAMLFKAKMKAKGLQ